ncbi:MAG: glycosyltransferase family 9 protein [Hyphomonadaceae bacterium]|nr:glycosyltransferase family 9 protein [Hyphomonadaceae bacterium]
MASVLFLAPGDLGETVLATGALGHILEAGDRLTVAAGDEAAPLFRAAPARTEWLEERRAATAGLSALLQGEAYDIVIDGRRDWAGRVFPARRRVARRAGAVLRHRAEEWAEAVGAARALAPTLWLDADARLAAERYAPAVGAPLLVLAPGGVSETKRWPCERFAAVARRLIDGPLAEAAIAVIGAAARDAPVTEAIARSLDADGVQATDLGEGLDLLAAGALMERATLVIGNDNALTHIAAAAGAPTLTLFGPTDERVRAPYGPRARALRGRRFEEAFAAADLDSGAAMRDVSTDAVEAAALDLLNAGGWR